MVNAWIPDFYLPDGSLGLDWHFGWIFDSGANGTHPQGYEWFDDRYWREYPMTWNIMANGMLQSNYTTPWRPERHRFWIPLAAEPITEDPVNGDPIVPAIRRFYVLEYEDQAVDRCIQPRINFEQEMNIPTYDFLKFCTPDWSTPGWSCTITP